MSSYAQWFEAAFGEPPPVARVLVSRDDSDAPMWFTSERRPELEPEAMARESFPEKPDAYCVSGSWGHGVSRQAFYFAERMPVAEHGRFEVFFRLAHGNAVGMNVDVVVFLCAYRDWLASFGSRLRFGRMTYGMGYGAYEVGLGDRVVSGKWPLAPNGAVLPADAAWAAVRNAM